MSDTPDDASEALIVADDKPLALTPQVANMVLALCARETMRRPRSNYEIAADPEFMERFSRVVTMLEAVRPWYTEHQTVFRQGTYRNVFECGLADLRADVTDTEQRQVVDEFDIDQWYAGVHALAGIDMAGMVAMVKGEAGQQKGAALDWFTETIKLERIMPGFIQLLSTTMWSELQSENMKRDIHAATVTQSDTSRYNTALRAEVFRQNRGETSQRRESHALASRSTRMGRLAAGRF